MKIIVDGYNVLKQAMRSPQVSQKEKDSFLLLLDRYARRKNHEIAVVFDGGEGGVATKEYIGDLLVLYSGSKESADDLIMRLLEKFNKLDILLVSSDRELRQKAAALSVTSLPALDFYTRLEDFEEQAFAQKKPQNKSIKTSRSENKELDTLMMQAGQAPKKIEEYVSDKTRTKKQPTKAERALLQKVNKL